MCKYKIRLSNSFIEGLKQLFFAMLFILILSTIVMLVSLVVGYTTVLGFPIVVQYLNHNLNLYNQSFIVGIFILVAILLVFMIISIPKDDYMVNKRLFEFRKNDIGHIKIKYSLKQYILDKLSFMIVCENSPKKNT